MIEADRPPYGADLDGLHLAAYNGDTDEVRDLLSSGVAVDQRDASGYTPLLWACFRAGVGERNGVDEFLLVVEELIDVGADIHAETGGDGSMNCLMLAARSGNAAVVRELLRRGALIDAAIGGITALMIAADHGNVEAVEALLEAGADAQLRCEARKASDFARRWGYDDLVHTLSRAEQAATEP